MAVIFGGMHQQFYHNIYDIGFDQDSLPPAERERLKAQHFSDRFSTAAAIVLHYFTLGIFSFIFYGLKHDELPRLQKDDPNGLTAVLLMFVPLFNYYWRFMLWVRFVKRLEMQYRLRDQNCPVDRNFALACMVCTFIPLANLVNFLVLMPILISRIQAAIDGLAVENRSAMAYSN